MIRPATQADIPALVDLCIEALNVDPYPQLVIDRSRVYEGVKECVGSARHFSWVSEVDGVIHGALGALVLPFLMYERNLCQIVIWYCRNPGDGMHLMYKLFEWIKGKPMIKQVLYEMNPKSDVRILKVFKRAGFTEVLPTLTMTR